MHFKQLGYLVIAIARFDKNTICINIDQYDNGVILKF